MKKYFFLQLKRTFKVFPFVLTVTLIMFLSLALILGGMLYTYSNSEENSKFNIGIAGDTDNDYLKWGMTALQTLDDTKFSIEFLMLDEESAKKKLSNGDISAYVVLPEDFIEKALSGNVEPIRYVTTPGSTGIISMFKNEVTQLVTDLVIQSEKGAYGIDSAIRGNGMSDPTYKYLNQLSLEYVGLILDRGELIEVDELGVTDGLSTAEYYICGITILFLMFTGLPYVTVNIKKDRSLDRLLCSKGFSYVRQLLCEYVSHFAAMFLLCAVMITLVGVGATVLGDTVNISYDMIASFSLRLLPILMMLSAFNVMIFELSDDIVSGVLMHFFSSLCMCYISGCFYPIYAFPKTIQAVSVFLPTGIARGCLASSFTGTETAKSYIGILVYSVLFFFIALAVRRNKTVNKRG